MLGIEGRWSLSDQDRLELERSDDSGNHAACKNGFGRLQQKDKKEKKIKEGEEERKEHSEEVDKNKIEKERHIETEQPPTSKEITA